MAKNVLRKRDFRVQSCFYGLCEEDLRLAISKAADLQAAVQRDEAGGEQRADAKHEALNAVPQAPGLSKHPGMTQAERGREGA